MKAHIAMTGIVLSALLWGSACEELQDEDIDEPVATALQPLTHEFTYEQRDNFRIEMERAIHQIDRRASELKARVARAGEDAQPVKREALDRADAGLSELRHDVEAVRHVTREEWPEWTSQFKAKAESLGRSIEQALSA